ncbi:MAG: hypothetical protein ACOY5H_03820 [Pseudomonadota bacterium]
MITTPPRLRRPTHWLAMAVALSLGHVAVHAEPKPAAWDTSYRRVLTNPEAVIPPQCYTRTEGRFNPCYTCHQSHPVSEGRPNHMDDGHLQGAYTFSDIGRENHWTNLFVDRRAAIAAISDAEISRYVAADNYTPLIETARRRGFRGWVPDLADLADPARAFDAQGRARDGSGWIAFQYKPLPSTFWPTNGSFDDVMIRLPPPFRQDAAGVPSWPVYLANLAILEAAIKGQKSIDTPTIDERAVGVDLDADGRLGLATRLRRPDHYLGGASAVPVVAFLYPVGTEFLHTVRYLAVDAQGEIHPAARMKEVRYLVKERWLDPAHLGALYDEEAWEKQQGMLPQMGWQAEQGAVNGFGWRLQGFIEDAQGQLRPQTQEETFFCKGCHTSIGATIDQTFAFARKIPGARGQGYIDLRGMPDAPMLGEVEGEIHQYLHRVGGGDEFRANGEMIERWFGPNGQPDAARLARARDVHTLITPSPARALALNKAYLSIVREQSFTRGRDATLVPTTNVYRQVDPDVPPLAPEHRAQGNIFLDWSSPNRP